MNVQLSPRPAPTARHAVPRNPVTRHDNNSLIAFHFNHCQMKKLPGLSMIRLKGLRRPVGRVLRRVTKVAACWEPATATSVGQCRNAMIEGDLEWSRHSQINFLISWWFSLYCGETVVSTKLLLSFDNPLLFGNSSALFLSLYRTLVSFSKKYQVFSFILCTSPFINVSS